MTTVQPIILSIEGNIGVGKSTMLANVQRRLGSTVGGRKCVFLREPVDDWQAITDGAGEDILTKFYRDQDKYAFPFQMMAYISRQALLMDAVERNPGSLIITERCVHTDKHVFAKMLHEDGKIEEVNYAIYNKWFETFSHKHKHSGHIYLRASPEVCHQRVVGRSRSGEEIPLEYLAKCHDNHDNWLAPATNTIIVQADDDMNDALDKYGDVCQRVVDFVKAQV